MIKTVLTGIAALTVASGVQATVVLYDNYDTEAGGGNALNYTAYANFDVTGQVDEVAPGNPYGISIATPVVDLDGTSGPGRLTTKSSYAFNAGDQVTLTFNLGGAQRGSEVDEFEAGFTFASTTSLTDYTIGGAWGTFDFGNYTTTGLTTSSSVAGTSPFQDYSITFKAATAGSLKAFVGTTSSDNVGPLLDTFTLDITAVPEPATWALMLAGFGMVGVAARRRVRSVAA